MTTDDIQFSLAGSRYPAGPVHLAIGVFDGVHLGHQALIEAAVHSAEREDGSAAVLTFHPHPSRLFRPETPTLMLMPLDEKCRLLKSFGVKTIIAQQFDTSFASLKDTAFVEHLIEQIPHLKSIYVGDNFRFGAGRKGDVGLLVKLLAPQNVSVVSIPRLNHNGHPISSTRIRTELGLGNISEVNRLLGHTYRTTAPVCTGKQLGRKLGFPTLNLPFAPEARPLFGVYGVRVRRISPQTSEWKHAVANYGVRPTVDAVPASPVLEVHALSPLDWQPGDRVCAEWLFFIRPERRFDSLDALVEQIHRDRTQAAAQFSQLSENQSSTLLR